MSNKGPRILFLGMQSNFSHPSFRALLESGIEVCGVIVPAHPNDAHTSAIRRLPPPAKRRGMLTVLDSGVQHSVIQMAWEWQIPIWEVQRMKDAEAIELFHQFNPDIICVACFSLYIPRVILAIPRLGCLNVHPSLLPDNRGPDPLFWTFRRGDTHTGVTIHLMDEGLDTGAILAQAAIEVPDGITYPKLEARCASLGGELLVQTVEKLYRGEAVSTPQDEAQSCYLPFPGAQDFIIDPATWDARHVYNFIRGVSGREEEIRLKIGERMLRVTKGISYSFEKASGENGGATIVHCKAGWVAVKGIEQL